jgi:hypothetical protein
MKKTKFNQNYTFKVFRNGVVIQRCQTHSYRRFMSDLRTINWQLKPLKVHLRVYYGEGFFNEGDYEKSKDLWLAARAFTEK